MNWPIDKKTQTYLENWLPKRFLSYNEPKIQHQGKIIKKNIWSNYVPNPSELSYYPRATPDNIIKALNNGHFLTGLALIVSWGKMSRNRKYIYWLPYDEISTHLHSVFEILRDSDTIEQSWKYLRSNLNWSNVMISKILHFMTRAHGENENPPVPIDNYIFIQTVWPVLIETSPITARPLNWKNDLEGYYRYMTFILFLKEYYNWTTTQVECTLFQDFNIRIKNKYS